MKDISKTIHINGKEYKLVFNLNVMQEIQQEFGSLDKWGKLTDGSTGEPNARAVIYGFKAMLNEGIDISNEENGTNEPLLTAKQAGRLVTGWSLAEATQALNETIIESTKTDSKNG